MPFAPAAAIGASALGGLTSAGGSILGADAQRQAASYQAQVATNNAAAARRDAGVALAQGDDAAEQQFQIGDARQGATRAAFGANNIELNSGSALGVQKSNALIEGENVAATQYNANTRAVGFLNQGSNDQSQAAIYRADAANALPAGLISAGGSLLGSASSVAAKWNWMKEGGPDPATPQLGGVY